MIVPFIVVQLRRTEDVQEREGEWRCSPARARALMLTPEAAGTIDRLAALSAEIDQPSPHGRPALDQVVFAFREHDGRQRFAGVIVRTPVGQVLRHSPVVPGESGSLVAWFLPMQVTELIASARQPEEVPLLEGTAKTPAVPAPAAEVAAPAASPRAKVKTLEDLIALGEEASFSDYAGVRSGRDAFSSKKLEKLREELGERATEAEEAARTLMPELEDAGLARVLRWVGRGLSPAQAARITQVHDELAEAHRGPSSAG
ncbi:hypothetical protein [Deinococcus hopiensis]|uniref:Uncharacterized protein n=1 Tax=Deinococcus hopiensis KR-140 TaxID=695939 RepID=A0A1W1VV66_9DEIO|nr:hypothetical protein [Deinococcus hopiensis]SMB97249.1 hypothetical protein SAMN00790413_06448 [Deinococcus hopiensis KR-140]